jgi:hypothetical protein
MNFSLSFTNNFQDCPNFQKCRHCQVLLFSCPPLQIFWTVLFSLQCMLPIYYFPNTYVVWIVWFSLQCIVPCWWYLLGWQTKPLDYSHSFIADYTRRYYNLSITVLSMYNMKYRPVDVLSPVVLSSWTYSANSLLKNPSRELPRTIRGGLLPRTLCC